MGNTYIWLGAFANETEATAFWEMAEQEDMDSIPDPFSPFCEATGIGFIDEDYAFYEFFEDGIGESGEFEFLEAYVPHEMQGKMNTLFCVNAKEHEHIRNYSGFIQEGAPLIFCGRFDLSE